jgi:hypothetical protein
MFRGTQKEDDRRHFNIQSSLNHFNIQSSLNLTIPSQTKQNQFDRDQKRTEENG